MITYPGCPKVDGILIIHVNANIIARRYRCNAKCIEMELDSGEAI